MSIPTRKAEPMTGSVTRIRWQDTPVGTISGHVGTVEQEVFAIWKPPQASGEWVLESEIPGLSAARCYSDDPGTLKAEAEGWLEGFVSSLGAVFPNALREVVTAERAHRDEAAGMAPNYEFQNRCWGWTDALDWVLALMDGFEKPATAAPPPGHPPSGRERRSKR